MKSRPGCSSRVGAILLLGLALLIPVSVATGVSSAFPIHANDTSACQAIVAANPEVNSTMFQQVCAEPSFQSAFASWGAANFSYGYGSNSSIFWQFYWVAPCTNASWAGMSCTYQEYWDGDLATGAVGGPFLMQHLAICACGVVLVKSPPGAAPSVVFPLLVLGTGALVGAGATLWRARVSPVRPRRPT